MRSALAVTAAVLLMVPGAPARAADITPEPPRFAASAGAAPVQLTLPAPTGRPRLGAVSVHLTDRSRPDPWVPAEQARELMIQVWYPARTVRSYPRADWVSPGAAEVINPPGSPVTLPVTHAHTGAPPAPGRHPVVLYSPGFGMERTATTALVEELAGHGYVVVTIDHTYEAQVVEFPGGRLAYNAVPPPADEAEAEAMLAKALAVRVADTRFVLGQLSGRALSRELKGAMDLSRIGMFGHSFGGATAAQAMFEDRRIRAGVNLDGTMSGSVLDGGLSRPFLLLGAEANGPEGDETWDRMWERLRGPRHELSLRGAKHLSFTDFQVLLPQSGTPAEQYEPFVGTIDGTRSIAVQRAYLRAFFDRYLAHRGGRLLAGPSPRYPEMAFVR